MTFTQLNYFISIAQNLSFSKASELLFVTQSTLSRSMASLESELEVTLFDRAYHNLKLTPAGEVLFRDGAKLMDSMNAVISRMQVLEQNQKNRLTIGILDGQKVENSVLRIVREVMELIPELVSTSNGWIMILQFAAFLSPDLTLYRPFHPMT